MLDAIISLFILGFVRASDGKWGILIFFLALFILGEFIGALA